VLAAAAAAAVSVAQQTAPTAASTSPTLSSQPVAATPAVPASSPVKPAAPAAAPSLSPETELTVEVVQKIAGNTSVDCNAFIEKLKAQGATRISDLKVIYAERKLCLLFVLSLSLHH